MSENDKNSRWLYSIYYWPREKGSSIFLSILLAITFAWMNYSLHENRLWFSNIQEVEREISFRTECGLYYSYYKQIINATGDKSPLAIHFSHAIVDLRNDQLSEAPHSINVIQRFNIFQEIILAAAYLILRSIYLTALRLISDISSYSVAFFPEFPTPIFFYVYSCFGFAGLGTLSIYFLTSALTNSVNWSTSLLAVSWMYANLEDATRVNFSINLRENFALPFFWLQNLYIIQILNENFSKANLRKYLFIVITTLFFSAFWQFNQFLLILQSVTLFGTLIISQLQNSSDGIDISEKICRITIARLVAFLVLIVIQDFQLMLLTSALIRFDITMIISILILNRIKLSNPAIKSAVQILIVAAMFAILTVIRQIIFTTHSDDSHIWEFANAKIGRLFHLFKNYDKLADFSSTFSILELSDLSFESAIYLCHGAFAFIDYEFFQRTSRSGLFPLYMLSVCGLLFSIFSKCYMNNQNKKTSKACDVVDPSMFYFSVQSVLSGIMACLMLRLKYVWLPQMTVCAACFVSKVLKKILGERPRTVILSTIAIGLLYHRYDAFRVEMLNEQEFYDPDTVQLMNWISTETSLTAIFAGSMQLMAGVKCCTVRPIANHPHFEDKQLRRRTQRLYQIYAKKSPDEIYRNLLAEKVNYIVLEESICFILPNGCTTTELIDLVNHHVPQMSSKFDGDSGAQNVRQVLERKGFTYETSITRFCDRIRRFNAHSPSMFRLSFQNPTFRVYQVLPP